MRKVSTLIAFLVISQGCYSYKEIDFNEIKIDKNYEVKLRNGQVVSGMSEKYIDDNLFLSINSNTVQFPKNSIEYIKRKKVSSIMVIGIVTMLTGGIIILLNEQEAPKLIKPYKQQIAYPE